MKAKCILSSPSLELFEKGLNEYFCATAWRVAAERGEIVVWNEILRRGLPEGLCAIRDKGRIKLIRLQKEN